MPSTGPAADAARAAFREADGGEGSRRRERARGRRRARGRVRLGGARRRRRSSTAMLADLVGGARAGRRPEARRQVRRGRAVHPAGHLPRARQRLRPSTPRFGLDSRVGRGFRIRTWTTTCSRSAGSRGWPGSRSAPSGTTTRRASSRPPTWTRPPAIGATGATRSRRRGPSPRSGTSSCRCRRSARSSDADEPATRAAILRDERTRLEARTARLQRALHRLERPRRRPTPDIRDPHHRRRIPVPTPPPPPELSPEVHRALGAGLYNRCWDLHGDRGPDTDQDDELIATAHASAWHWRQVGHTANQSRAPLDVLPRLRRPRAGPSRRCTTRRRCVEIVEAGGEGIEDWDAPGAYEAMARALARRRRPRRRGRVEGRRRPGCSPPSPRPDDRGVIEGDLATLPV